MMNRRALVLYCAGAAAALMVWVVGEAGLGPIDDHQFMRTIFQGKEFGSYGSAELGRFFPLTAQEYVVTAKVFGPSAQMFYLISAFKVVPCGCLLFFCLTLTGLGNFASALLWTAVIFSMGTANTLFRLSVGELNALILMLLFSWCVLRDQQSPKPSRRAGYAIAGFSAFVLALFYKELIFIFGLIFGLSEIVRATWAKRSRPSVFVVAIFSAGLLYIVSYAIWLHIHMTRSYAAMHATSPWHALGWFAVNDPFIIFVVLPVTAFRVVTILRHPEQYSVYDSFLLAASAYAGGFLSLALFNTYYLLPSYAFAACGLAGVLASHLHKIPRRIILVFVLLFNVNIFPCVLSVIQTQKLITENHFQFVCFLSGWLQNNTEAARSPRNVVLVGVSPGSGAEILVSLKTYLVSLGTPESAFKIKATEPSDNEEISESEGFKNERAYKPEANDILVFNPYQSVAIRPPRQPTTYKEIYRSASEWAPPRWLAWHWIKHCVFSRGGCAARVSENMIYTGYAAMLLTSEAVPSER